MTSSGDINLGRLWVRFSRCQRCLSRLVPSLGWDTVGEKYGHFYVENLRRVTALPKCKSISIKISLCIIGCLNYRTAYSLKQFLPPMPKMATLKTATTRLFTSVCTCLFVTSREFLARDQCVNMIIIYILVFYCANAKKYWDMHLCNWKQHSLTIFSQFLTRCLNGLSFHKTIHYSNSRHTFWKNKPLPSHCPRKIGYTFYGPCPHGLGQVMVWCLQAPSHYMNPCWLTIEDFLWHSSDRKYIWHQCKISSTSSLCAWVIMFY